MTYRGRVKNGVIIIDGQPQIAEGTIVEIQPIDDRQAPTIAERFADVLGKAEGLPEDFAENHDHYIHGAPKKQN
jgi:hypothetical protein